MRNTESAVKREIEHTFRSLRYRNYRLYFTGQLLSLTGTWMQSVALSWLVYKMTRSPLLLGVVEGAHLLPVLFLGMAGGLVADRADKKTVLILAQLIAMAQAITLAALTLTHHIEVWHCVALALVLGTVNAFEVPSRQAFLPELVDRDDLVNAISLNSSLFNGARVLGPALAGILVPFAGEGVCFLLNALSYTATLLAFVLINAKAPEPIEEQESSGGLLGGWRFVLEERTVLRLLLLGAVMSLLGMNYGVLMPVFASEILHGDVRTLAVLRAGAGIGAFAAALALASRGTGERLKSGVGYASMTFGSVLACFAWSTNFWLSLALICMVGFAMTTQLSGGHSLVQLAVNDRVRGRVLSIYMTVMMGLAPLGSMVIGWAAGKWSAPPVVTFCGFACAAAGLLYTLVNRKVKTGSDDGDENLD
ncbi:MAG TPA: MFS transporter [Candidatus Obscuribacterales bacterium]